MRIPLIIQFNNKELNIDLCLANDMLSEVILLWEEVLCSRDAQIIIDSGKFSMKEAIISSNNIKKFPS